jgi:superoxide dismutase, Fe-Mn family
MLRAMLCAVTVVAVAAAVISLAGAQSTSINKGGTIMKHELTPLPYAYNALEPYYDEETVRLHHDKHQAAYVNGQNKAEETLAELREKGDFAQIAYWERQLAFNASGNFLHTMFWENMAPNGNGGGGDPSGELAKQIETDFGSIENFRKQFTAVATTVEGSGWAMLGWSPDFKKLYILQIENHQKLILTGIEPLLVCDMWEHAYYLKYQNRRPDWVEAWWHLVNWADVAKRFSKVEEHAPELVKSAI